MYYILYVNVVYIKNPTFKHKETRYVYLTKGLPIYENKQSNHQTMRQLFHCFNK